MRRIIVAVSVIAALAALSWWWFHSDSLVLSPPARPAELLSRRTDDSSRPGRAPEPRQRSLSSRASLDNSAGAIPEGNSPVWTSGDIAAQERMAIRKPQPGGTALSIPDPEEDAPDAGASAIPATLMKCSWDGGVFSCGDCRSDADCPAGHGCLRNWKTRREECLPSECEEDAHCFPGFVCRVANLASPGPPIRRCVEVGARKDGERCRPIPSESCVEGLTCIAGFCAGPCVNGPEQCPTGKRCLSTPEGRGCVPDCKVAGCAEGLRCMPTVGERYECARAIGENCKEKPCAAGQQCQVFPRGGDEIAFWCAASCAAADTNSCPQGYFCDVRRNQSQGSCLKRCDPNVADSCEPGWVCGSTSPDRSVWGCRPRS